jgi:MFS family permease
MYFSTSILSPVFPSSAKAAALALVLFKISLTALPAFIVERTGTKPLMLYPTALMSVSLVVLAVGINTNTPVAAIAGIMAFVAAFSQGPGPITWVVLATALPPHARAAASAVALSINWLCNFVVGVAFLPLQAYLAGSRGQQGDVFYVFAFLCAVSVVGVWAGYRRLEAV